MMEEIKATFVFIVMVVLILGIDYWGLTTYQNYSRQKKFEKDVEDFRKQKEEKQKKHSEKIDKMNETELGALTRNI